MKHADLIRRIVEDGAVLARSRGGHDIYRNVITGDTRSDRRWAQLTRDKGEEAVQQTARRTQTFCRRLQRKIEELRESEKNGGAK